MVAYECKAAVETASGRCWNATHDGADRCEAHGGPNGLPVAGAAVSTVISPRHERSDRRIGDSLRDARWTPYGAPCASSKFAAGATAIPAAKSQDSLHADRSSDRSKGLSRATGSPGAR